MSSTMICANAETAAVSSDHGREGTPEDRRATRASIGRAAARRCPQAPALRDSIDFSRGEVVPRVRVSSKSMREISAISTTGPVSGGCAAATGLLQLSRRASVLSAGCIVRVGGSGACGAALSAHDGQLGGDDERSAQPTTMAEVDADGEQRRRSPELCNPRRHAGHAGHARERRGFPLLRIPPGVSGV